MPRLWRQQCGKVGGESIVNVIGGRKVEVIGVTASMHSSVQNHRRRIAA